MVKKYTLLNFNTTSNHISKEANKVASSNASNTMKAFCFVVFVFFISSATNQQSVFHTYMNTVNTVFFVFITASYVSNQYFKSSAASGQGGGGGHGNLYREPRHQLYLKQQYTIIFQKLTKPFNTITS